MPSARSPLPPNPVRRNGMSAPVELPAAKLAAALSWIIPLRCCALGFPPPPHGPDASQKLSEEHPNRVRQAIGRTFGRAAAAQRYRRAGLGHHLTMPPSLGSRWGTFGSHGDNGQAVAVPTVHTVKRRLPGLSISLLLSLTYTLQHLQLDCDVLRC
jgi:hypothetical protein